MANSTRARSGAKTKPKFPLWLHTGSGQWAKTIRGHRYYFGTDRDKALAEYTRTRDDLEAGRVPQPPDSERPTLKLAVNTFLTHKKHQVETGELGSRMFGLYHSTCERILKHLGKSTFVDQVRPGDLLSYRRKMAQTLGSHALTNEVTRVRSVFLFAFNNGLIDRPIAFGEFKRPSKSVMRRQRSANGPKMFEAEQLRRILAAANPSMRAMVLLGLNCGFGNTDVATLPISAVDLDGGWIDYPRPKTGVPRRCPLWPATRAAIQTVLAARDDDHPVVFVTSKLKQPWANGTRGPNGITHEMAKLLRAIGEHHAGIGFYALRHTFQTVADELGDYLATRRIMGHVDPSISDAYRERFSDDRLCRVANHVKAWLYTVVTDNCHLSQGPLADTSGTGGGQ